MKIINHLSCFFITVVLALLYLVVGACIPQSSIDKHILTSSEQLSEEGVYPEFADYTPNSHLDNYTDAIILAESKAMSLGDISSVLTNPTYGIKDSNPVHNLYLYSHGEINEPNGYYVRYWMGFRPSIRFLSLFFSYFQIKRYVAFTFYLILSAAICQIATKIGTRMALIFAACIGAVRPYVIGLSLQFSCCFFIAILAMLIIPLFINSPEKDTLLFMEIGMLTMFFDFYTTPIVTFGLPFVYLFLLREKQNSGNAITIKSTIQSIAAWFAGYVGMWISRLVLVSLFTDVNGIRNGFNAFYFWMSKDSSVIEKTFGSLRSVWNTLTIDKYGAAVVLLIVVTTCFFWVITIAKRKIPISKITTYSGLILVASLPFVWFAVASYPTQHHTWFQYRSISVSIWAFGAFLLLPLYNHSIEKNN